MGAPRANFRETCLGVVVHRMIYSYPFALCGRGVIATFDLAAKNLEALRKIIGCQIAGM